MRRSRVYMLILVVVIAVAGYLLFFKKINDDSSVIPNQTDSTTLESTLLSWPIDRARERVTKKPFGIYVTPANSPVSPEKFTGYHTGVDFETFADEQEKDVTVYAICDGALLERTTATGYGGVAVQQCVINNEPVVVVYGHLKLASVAAKLGQELKHGEKLAVLGKGYSSETSGERKHLHLGIHKGTVINIRGYVQKQTELGVWIDFMRLEI